MSGTVSTGELASVMSTLGQKIDEKEVGMMISEVDSDGAKLNFRIYRFPFILFNDKMSDLI